MVQSTGPLNPRKTRGTGTPVELLKQYFTTTALFLARLRFCVHYCMDRDAVKKKNHASRGFWTLSEKNNRASRGFLIGLSTKTFRKIWKQDNQTNVIDLTMRTLTTHTHTHTHTDT